jgi:hypothetical protein
MATNIDDINLYLSSIEPDEYDILVVIGAPYLKSENLKKFKRKVNLHIGILPEYRGSYAVEWSTIMEGRAGFTLHDITGELDGGGLYHAHKILMSFGNYWGDYMNLIFESIISMNIFINKNDYSIKTQRGFNDQQFLNFEFNNLVAKHLIEKIKHD